MSRTKRTPVLTRIRRSMAPGPRGYVAAYVLSLGAAAACAPSALRPAAGDATPNASSSKLSAESGGAAVETCTAWATFQEGPYKYENNVWGSAKAQGKFEQCLLKREVLGRTQYGWRWDWPGFDKTVFSYPQIIFGWKPWSGGDSTDSRFPVRISSIEALTLSYGVVTEASGSYNLAPEIWLIGAGTQASTAANPSIITAEVMFWMDYKSGAQPAGRVVSTPVLDGITYELWKEDSIGDKGDGTGWVLFSFKSPKIQHRGSVSVHSMLQHLVEAKHVSPEDQVASVEFGNEVMGGSGKTWVEHFEVAMRP